MRAVYRGAGRGLAPSILIAAAVALSISAPAQAQGLGLSGNFYRQHYELAPGESLPAGDVYVVVSNSSDSPLVVDMVTQTPPEVTLLLSDDSFTLAPGAQQQVYVGVQVSAQAALGEYALAITAEAQREGTGIKVSAGVQQTASLSVIGTSGRVTITSVTETGEPFPALIGIYQEASDGLAEVRPPETGKIEARLPPGDYVAQASYQDVKVAEESFSLADGDQKDITLTSHTISITDFKVSRVPAGNGDITSATISYTIVNLYQPLDDVKASLKVAIDSQPLDETELVSFSTLDVGSRGGSLNYIPAQGWQNGHTYGFLIELYTGGNLLYQTATEELALGGTPPPATTSSGAPKNNNRPLIIGIIAGTAATIGVAVGVRRRRTNYLTRQIRNR